MLQTMLKFRRLIFHTVILLPALILSLSCTTWSPDHYLQDMPPVDAGETVTMAQSSWPDAAEDQIAEEPNTGPLQITLQEAILLAMENNQALTVERLNPEIAQTFEEEERAVFDPTLGANLSSARTIAERLARSGSSTETSTRDTVAADASLSTLLPTGTTAALDVETSNVDSSLYSDEFSRGRVGASVTQALLRGAGVHVNLANIRQARLDTLATQYELRAFAEALLALVESTYWDFALAERQIEIYTHSLELAQQQLEETRQRIEIGNLAATELAAAQSEVALRQEDLITARSDLAKARLRLVELLNPGVAEWWDRPVVLQDQPSTPNVVLDDVKEHVQVALQMRPDLNQAKLLIQRGDLQIVKTRNGLLPKLDLIFICGLSGNERRIPQSFDDIDGDNYDILFGVSMAYPLKNREAQARFQRSVATRQQSEDALANLTQIVQREIRIAYIDVERTGQEITATAVTLKFQEETYRAEQEKFRVGRSTSLLVAQAQGNLVQSQIDQIEAVVNYLKALVNLHWREGSLLERRGVAAPGRQAVTLKTGGNGRTRGIN